MSLQMSHVHTQPPQTGRHFGLMYWQWQPPPGGRGGGRNGTGKGWGVEMAVSYHIVPYQHCQSLS